MIITGSEKQRSYSGDYMKAGLEAQEVVLCFLRKRPDVIGVDDLSLLKIMQEADVDCMIKTADGLVILAEIKSDRWIGKTGNILFEVLRINHTTTPDHCVTLGWSARTPAKYLIFYNPDISKVFVIALDELRKGMQRYTGKFRKGTNISFVETDNIKSTVNILVPQEYVKFATFELLALDNS
jgi:hypothetical protein